MSNVLIGFQNLVDQSTSSLTTTSQVTSLPVDNLKNQLVRKVWRTAGTASASVILDSITAQSLQLVGLLGCNATAGATFQVRVSDSDPTGEAGEIYDSGMIVSGIDPIYKSFIHIRPMEKAGRYTRLDITDVGSQGYLEAGRFFVGPFWQPSIGVQFGLRKGYADPSNLDSSLGGQIFIDRRPKARRWTLSLDFVTEAEVLAGLAEIDRIASGTEDILMVLDPDSSNLGRDSLWGLLSNPSGIETSHHDVNRQSYVLTERL